MVHIPVRGKQGFLIDIAVMIDSLKLSLCESSFLLCFEGALLVISPLCADS